MCDCLCFDLENDFVACGCSQSVRLFFVLTWLMMLLFVVAHKGCDGLCFDLVIDIVVCCCSQSV